MMHLSSSRRQQLKRLASLAVVPIVLACGSSTSVDPALFVLNGAWRGDLISLSPQFPGSFGELQLNLVGESDGRVEQYSGDGLFIQTNRVLRFQSVDAEYDTTAATLDLAIIDLTSLFGFITGTFDGDNLMIVDSARCGCEAVLQRQ